MDTKTAVEVAGAATGLLAGLYKLLGRLKGKKRNGVALTLEGRLDELHSTINQRFNRVDERLSEVERRDRQRTEDLKSEFEMLRTVDLPEITRGLQRKEHAITAIEKRVGKLETSCRKENQLIDIESRIDKLEDK